MNGQITQQIRTSKTRRLVLLYRLRKAGILDNLTLQQISEILGVKRAPLLRDLWELDTIETEFQKLMEVQPWKERVPPSRAIEDEKIEATKRLLRDGLVWLQNWVPPRDADV